MKQIIHIALFLFFLLMGITGTQAQVNTNGEHMSLNNLVVQNHDETTDKSSDAADSKLLVKTNLVYDALLSPSIEIEYRLAPHWSVLADYSLAWWSIKNKHYYYHLMQFGAEARYWFNADKGWHGHYLGVFAGGGYYDLEKGYTGYKGEFIMSGVGYGYMFPIGERLSLDAGIGAGALATLYEEYLPIGGHYVYQQTGRTNYFGPLKLRLALTWKLGNGGSKNSSDRQKGGRR